MTPAVPPFPPKCELLGQWLLAFAALRDSDWVVPPGARRNPDRVVDRNPI